MGHLYINRGKARSYEVGDSVSIYGAGDRSLSITEMLGSIKRRSFEYVYVSGECSYHGCTLYLVPCFVFGCVVILPLHFSSFLRDMCYLFAALVITEEHAGIHTHTPKRTHARTHTHTHTYTQTHTRMNTNGAGCV